MLDMELNDLVFALLVLFWSIFICYPPFLPFNVELFTLYHCIMEIYDLFNFGGILNQDPVLSLALLDAIRTIQVGSNLHLEMDMNLQEAGAKYYYLIVKCPQQAHEATV